MNQRLQTRCLVSSALAHALLLGVLLFMPGFRSERPLENQLGPGINLIPGELVDAALAAGSTGPAPAQPAATREPAPTPPPPREAKAPTPTPPAEKQESVPPAVQFDLPKLDGPGFVLPRSPSPEKPAPKPTPKPTPRFDFSKAQPVKPASQLRPEPLVEKPSGPSPERVQRDRINQLARSIASASGALERSSGGRGTVNVQITATGNVGGTAGGGGGGGGGASAYAYLLRNAFDRAWVAPRNVSDDLATADVEVGVRRDGKILSARIVKRSGVAALDRSVQETLARVTQVPAFEPGAPEETRTFVIGFNLRGKRSF